MPYAVLWRVEYEAASNEALSDVLEILGDQRIPYEGERKRFRAEGDFLVRALVDLIAHCRGHVGRLEGEFVPLLKDSFANVICEAIRAAKTWYLALAGKKLPIWSYRVETLPDFRRAVGHYKSQIAMALGCNSSRLKLRVEAPAGSWFRH